MVCANPLRSNWLTLRPGNCWLALQAAQRQSVQEVPRGGEERPGALGRIMSRFCSAKGRAAIARGSRTSPAFNKVHLGHAPDAESVGAGLRDTLRRRDAHSRRDRRAPAGKQQQRRDEEEARHGARVLMWRPVRGAEPKGVPKT